MQYNYSIIRVCCYLLQLFFRKKIILLFFISIPLANAGIEANIVFKNNCSFPVKFSWNYTGMKAASDLISLDTNSTFSLIKRGNTRISLKYYDNKYIEKGSISMRFFELIMQKNIFKVNAMSGNIGIDNKTMVWHNWYETPSFTVTFCPAEIDIKRSPFFSNTTEILIFGDSLSDTGNLHKNFHGLAPKSLPYYNGTFSNGEIWSRLLVNELKGKIPIKNYAVGGASVTLHSNVENLLGYSLADQISHFEAYDDLKKKKEKNYLAFIWIGANDYLNVPGKISEKGKTKLMKDVLKGIDNAVHSLLQRNVKKIVFIGIPDVGLTPISSQYHMNSQAASDLAGRSNEELQIMIDSYKTRYPDLEFIFCDFTEILHEVTGKTKEFNQKYQLQVTDIEHPCWRGGYFQGIHSKKKGGIKTHNPKRQFPGSAHVTAASMASTEGALCPDPEHHLFWDNVHPTAQVHRIIYNSIKKKLGIKAVGQF